MTTPWQLDPRLQADSECLHEDHTLQCRGVTTAPWPWLILIPKHPGATEWHDLPAARAQQLLNTALHLAPALKTEFNGDKVNIATLGNVVSQLHLHLVIRHHTDPAWPGPIWGHTWEALGFEARREQALRLRRVVEENWAVWGDG